MVHSEKGAQMFFFPPNKFILPAQQGDLSLENETLSKSSVLPGEHAK